MRVIIKESARDDLARIYEFNIDRSASWASKVEGRLLERARTLGANSHVGRPIARTGTRRLSLPDIQYVMDYQLRENSVEVLRFQHSREIR